MGEVYLAQDTKLDRKVALKILPAGGNRGQASIFAMMSPAKAGLESLRDVIPDDARCARSPGAKFCRRYAAR
jgi:serine/threonine protein kinase